MKDLITLTKDVERDLVVNIVMSVKYGRLTKTDSKKLAKEFLEKSFNSYENMFKSLYELRDYREIRKIYVKYAPDYYLEKSKLELGNLRKFMKGENYGN